MSLSWENGLEIIQISKHFSLKLTLNANLRSKWRIERTRYSYVTKVERLLIQRRLRNVYVIYSNRSV